MIIEFFLTVFIVGILLIILGGRVDFVLGIIGGIILMLLGFSLAFSVLQIHETDSISITYSYLNSTTGVINSTNETHTANYSTFDNTLPVGSFTLNRLIAILLMIAGLASIAGMVMHRQGAK